MEQWRPEIILYCVVMYMLMCIGVGLWSLSRTKSTKDFFMAGRDLGIVVTSVAVFSTTPNKIATAVKKAVLRLPYRAATASGSEIDSRSSANSRIRFPNRKNEMQKPIEVQITIQMELIPRR